MMQDFEQKFAVVTAGTQGIGFATAQLLLQRGAAGVAICGRNKDRGLLASKALGGKAFYIDADLSEPNDCFRVVDKAYEKFSRVDVLINACGASERGTLEDTNGPLFDYIFAVNVRAPFFLMQRVAPFMRANGGGTIVNIGSVAAYGGQPYLAAYSASKAALVTLTKNVANALRWDNIRVNAVNIGWTETPNEHQVQMSVHGQPDDWAERAGENQPFKRLLRPEDVARILTFLASDESALMTGSIVDFDQWVIGATDDNPNPRWAVGGEHFEIRKPE